MRTRREDAEFDFFYDSQRRGEIAFVARSRLRVSPIAPRLRVSSRRVYNLNSSISRVSPSPEM